MRPIFTVHAGEYVVASEIEKSLKKFRVWVPSKDEGVDLLVTNQNRTKCVGLQVKFSKDYSFLGNEEDKEEQILRKNLQARGWWTFDRKKIQESKADLWVLVLPSFESRKYNFIIIKPKDLLRRYGRIHGKQERIQSYFWVTKKNQCWEARDLSKVDRGCIAEGAFHNDLRNFTIYLDNRWVSLQKAMR